MHKLRFRQVHLDFHTSPDIPGIGEKFDKENWQQTLKDARVDSITCFATCHHGYAYYKTEAGEMHPHLKFDLLRAQFDACKEIDVNVPIYLTAGANTWAGDKHPEWQEIRPGGIMKDPLMPGFKKICFNTPYLDLLCEQIKEVAKEYPDCDGIFLDIISQGQCCCKWCMESMLKNGFDPEQEEDRKAHALTVLEKYYKATTAAGKTYDSNMTVFHNSGHITVGARDKLKYFNHLELESLPTGGWGYDHFPLSAKYCGVLDFDFLGMTGKFHTTWGEFGGYKHPNALRYECAAMIAMGAKCSVGDQLHPAGMLDKSTYRIIGEAYKEVEEKEPWCDKVKNVADIGLVSTVATNHIEARECPADIGAGRVLLEGHMLFDILDTEADLSPYKLIILSDHAEVSAKLKVKIDAYLAKGGKLLITGDSGLDSDKTSFLWDIGADYEGKSEFTHNYILPDKDYRPSFCDSPIVMYMPSNNIKATSGVSLGGISDPYFNRSYKHFCSHQHTPYTLDDSVYDCGVINGNIMYLAHPVFSIYRWYGAVVYKEYILNAINKLLGNDVSVRTNMSSIARLNMMEQEEEKRYILHLLYASKILRGGDIPLSGGNIRATKPIEIIEDLDTLSDTTVSVKTEKKIKRISLEPQGKEIEFELKDGRVCFKVDSFKCHQMIVLHY